MAKPPPPEPMARKSVTLPESMWREIAEFRTSEQMGSEAEAIRQLVRSGLRQHARRKPRAAKEDEA